MYPYTVAPGTTVLLAPPVAASQLNALAPSNASVSHPTIPASQGNRVAGATMGTIAHPRSNDVYRSTSAGPRTSGIYRSSSATPTSSYRTIYTAAPVQPVAQQHVAMQAPSVMKLPSALPLIAKASGLAASVQSGTRVATSGCPWQFDASAFKHWAKTAVEVAGSSENNQLYGFLTECFLDADGDKDGLVSIAEFDFLVEKAAKLPRRFGLAPNWSEMYRSIEERQNGRMAMFAKLDTESRKAIGLNEWINWSFTHIAEKVRGMDMKSMNWNALETMGKGAFIEFCRKAVTDIASLEYKELYAFLFKSFVDADTDQKGTITLQQFDALVEKVAAAPRSLGLAPTSSDMFRSPAERQASRMQLFNAMDTDLSGTITFDEFLRYTVNHIAEKVQSAGPAPVKPGEHTTARASGLRPWQLDKRAFKQWARSAIENPNGSERRELYSFLCECFMDADSDRDGFVRAGEFDFLVEQAAALPRRFGLAPTWPEAYGDIQKRQVARAEMFRMMDADCSGGIGLEEWVQFSLQHIAEKVRTMNVTTVDFNNLEALGVTAFLRFLRKAVANAHSEEYKELYAFLYKNFVEADADQKGSITLEQFDVLVEKSANAPRSLGLAPTSASMFRTIDERVTSRNQLFQAMDADGSGTITFDEYLRYTINHIANKVNQK